MAWLALESPDWQPSYPFPERYPAILSSMRCGKPSAALCVYCGRRLHP